MTGWRRMVLATPTLLVVVGWWAFVWNPKAAEFSAASERRDTLAMQSQRLSRQIADVQRYVEGGNAVAEQHERARRWIPVDTELPSLIASHDALARSALVRVRSFTPIPPDPTDSATGPEVTSLRLNVTVEGTNQAIDAYLAGLFELPRLVVVDTLRLAPNGDGLVQLDLTLRAFSERSTEDGVTPVTVDAPPEGT